MQTVKTKTVLELEYVRTLMGKADRRLLPEEVALVMDYAFDRTRINEENELLLQSGGFIPEEIVAEELGAELVEAFYYLDGLLFSNNRSERRPDAKEKRRHAYDSAYRAVQFGFSEDDARIALLHDVLEYTSKNLQEAYERSDEIKNKFGEYASTNVVTLADFHAILTNEIARKMQKDGRRVRNNSDIGKYLQRIKGGLTNAAMKRNNDQFKDLESIIGSLNARHIAAHHDTETHFSIYDEIKQRATPLFVDNIFKNARSRIENGDTDYYVPLAARAISYIDRVRTMRGSNTLPTINEAELFIEKIGMFNRLLERSRIVNNAIQVMDVALKMQILEQTRAIVDGYKGRDTAFLSEKVALEKKLNEMERKYAAHAYA